MKKDRVYKIKHSQLEDIRLKLTQADGLLCDKIFFDERRRELQPIHEKILDAAFYLVDLQK